MLATVRSPALAHIRHAMLLYVLVHFHTYVMLRYYTFSCMSTHVMLGYFTFLRISTRTSCYATAPPVVFGYDEKLHVSLQSWM